MRTQRLNRPCRTCDKMFLPKGKYNRTCKECLIKVVKIRMQNLNGVKAREKRKRKKHE